MLLRKYRPTTDFQSLARSVLLDKQKSQTVRLGCQGFEILAGPQSQPRKSATGKDLPALIRPELHSPDRRGANSTRRSPPPGGFQAHSRNFDRIKGGDGPPVAENWWWTCILIYLEFKVHCLSSAHCILAA